MHHPRRRKSHLPGLRKRISNYFRRREAIREERARRRYKKKIAQKHRKESARREKELNKVKINARLAESSKAPGTGFKRSSFVQFLNSLVIFILTYVLVYLVYQFTVILTASLWELDATLYFYDLAFDDLSSRWTRLNIILITFSGPFMCLIAGVLLYLWLMNYSRFRGNHKLFILWFALHSINHFLGALASGIMTDEGFGYVVNWLYVVTVFKILLALVALFILGIIGYFTAGRFLETKPRASRTGNRPFLIRQALLPWLVGSFILLLVRIPYNFNFPYETIMISTMGLLTVPPLFNRNAVPRLWLVKEKSVKRPFSWGYFILLLAFLSFYRVELGRGLHIYVKMQFSMTVTRER